MRIEYLDIIFSACFSLRKIKQVTIMQNPDNYIMRPQMHILFVAPFGSGKSSIMKKIGKRFPDDMFFIDDFTKPSLEGSIDKATKDYVPSFLVNCGGKVMVVDEWNNVDSFGQNALLSVLENQRVLRSIGFKVNHPYKLSNEYMDFEVKENVIKARINFSCIACAMEYPIYENHQKAKALMSRFSPYFVELDNELIKLIVSGQFEINVSDFSCKVDNVVITKKCYLSFLEKYWEYLDVNHLIPSNPNDKGFCTRTSSDITRLGIFNYLRKNNPKSRDVIIGNVKYFSEMLKYSDLFLRQYLNPKTKGKIQEYERMIKQYPNEKINFYAGKLGVSERTIMRYNEELK